MIWGVLGGIGIGVVILFLWRLIVPGHTVEEATLSSESIEPTSASTSDDEVVTARGTEPPKPVAPEQIVEVHPAQPPVVTAPVVVPSEPEPRADTQASAPVAAKDEPAAAPTKATEKAEAPRAEEPKRVAAPAKQDTAPPPPKEKPVVASAPVVSEPKPVVVAPPAREEEEPPAAKEPVAPAPPSAPNPGFNKDAAVATLNTAAAAAARCPKDATGLGAVRVIFDPEGSVRSVSIISGDFEATAAGTCVTRAFERCKVPPFSGKPAAVSRRFEIKPKPPEE
jgi:hypothetical protein